MSDVTRILEAVQQGDPAAAKDLLPLVYEELRRLARSKMAQQAAGHTLQPTALINDLFCAVSANQLFGRAEKAEQIGRAFYDRQSFSLQDIPSAYQATVKYLSGASQEAEALNADSAVTSVCSVRHFIALRHLGKRRQGKSA